MSLAGALTTLPIRYNFAPRLPAAGFGRCREPSPPGLRQCYSAPSLIKTYY